VARVGKGGEYEGICSEGICSDAIGLFYPMKDVVGSDNTKVLVTPVRASFNTHPGKLNFQLKVSDWINLEVKKLNGFITEYCLEDSNTFTYIPLGTASPKSTISSKMVLEVEKLKSLCELFQVDMVNNKNAISEAESVTDFFNLMMESIHEHLDVQLDPSDLSKTNTCGICAVECIIGDNKVFEDRKELICSKCADPDIRDKELYSIYRKNHNIPAELELKISKDSFYDSHWDEASESRMVKDAVLNDPDWIRTHKMYEDLGKNYWNKNIWIDSGRYILFRIILQQLLMDHWKIYDKKKACPYKSHKDFTYKERYNPWLKLWSLFQIFNLQLNTFGDDYETYFQEVYRLASMEFSTSDIPSMIVDNKINMVAIDEIKGSRGGVKTDSGCLFSLTLTCIEVDVDDVIKSQEAHSTNVNERVLNGICW